MTTDLTDTAAKALRGEPLPSRWQPCPACGANDYARRVNDLGQPIPELPPVEEEIPLVVVCTRCGHVEGDLKELATFPRLRERVRRIVEWAVADKIG